LTGSQFVFRATIVHEKEDYWLKVASPHLRHDVNCVISAASAAAVTPMIIFSQLLQALATVN